MAVIAGRASALGQACAIAMSDRFAYGKKLATLVNDGARYVASGVMIGVDRVAAAHVALTATLRAGVSATYLKAHR